jgi:hypothetical protein
MSGGQSDLYGDILKVAVPVVQALVVVIGWKVVSRDNDKREARKEIRSILNEVRRLSLEVETLAVQYYQSRVEDGRDQGTLLKRHFKQIGILLTSTTRQNHKVELSAPLADFRSEVTGADFESSTRVQVEMGHARIQALADATTRFLDEVEIIFASAYSR